jgi:Bacterial regulatory proteins, gntR family
MPLADQFTAALACARTTHAVDDIARLLWKAHGERQLTDIDAMAISEALQRNRAALAMRAYPKAKTPVLAKRREPRSPDRRASIERRRRQAMSGIVPAKLAASFTLSELAVLSVIGWQVKRAGACSLPIDAIAALAGVSRTTVKRALRQARAVGLVLVRERRIPGRKSQTNVVTAIGAWSAWLRIAGQMRPSTDIQLKERSIREGSARNVPGARPPARGREALRLRGELDGSGK